MLPPNWKILYNFFRSIEQRHKIFTLKPEEFCTCGLETNILGANLHCKQSREKDRKWAIITQKEVAGKRPICVSEFGRTSEELGY